MMREMTATASRGDDLHRRLLEIASAIAPDISAARFEAALESFASALESDAIRKLLNTELNALLRGTPAPTKSAPAGQLRIVSGPDADMRLRVVQPANAPASAFIKTLTRNTLIGNAGNAPFAVRRWLQKEPFPNDVFDARKTIEAAGAVALFPGKSISLRAGYDAYEIAPTDRAAAVVTLAGTHAVPLTWLYRRDTRRAISVEPVARDWLRIQELLAFADAIGDASLAPALASLAVHPSHFVRWAAAKSALRVAPARADATLRALADDRHPQLRAAARLLLANRTPA